MIPQISGRFTADTARQQRIITACSRQIHEEIKRIPIRFLLCSRRGNFFRARLVRASWARWWVGLPGGCALVMYVCDRHTRGVTPKHFAAACRVNSAGAPQRRRPGGRCDGMGQDVPAGQGATLAAGSPISPMPIPTCPAEHNPDAAISGDARFSQ